MSRHRINETHTSLWRALTALLGVFAMVVAMAVTGSTANADDEPLEESSPWSISMTVSQGDPASVLTDGSTVDVGAELNYTVTVSRPATDADFSGDPPVANSADSASVTLDLSGLTDNAAVDLPAGFPALVDGVSTAGVTVDYVDPTSDDEADLGSYVGSITFTATVDSLAYGKSLNAAATITGLAPATSSLKVADYDGTIWANMNVTKTVTGTDVGADGTSSDAEVKVKSLRVKTNASFDYNIRVQCQEEPCIGATLDDEFPPGLAGYTLSTTPLAVPANIPYVARWSFDGGDHWVDDATAAGHSITSNTLLHLDFVQPLSATTKTPQASGKIGLKESNNFLIGIGINTPTTKDPGPDNGWYDPDTNNVSVSAINSTGADDTATTQLYSPESLGATLDKRWCAIDDEGEYVSSDCATRENNRTETAAANTSARSKITLKATTGNSNVAVDKFVITEPQLNNDETPVNTNNPFRIVDLVPNGIYLAQAPSNAGTVQVDAYDGASWHYGTPQSLPIDDGILDLPGDITTPGQVAALRITFNGSIEKGATAVVELTTRQRGEDRNPTDETKKNIAINGATITNVAEAWTEKGDLTSGHASSSWTYKLTLPQVKAYATKDIEPKQKYIDSNGAVQQMTWAQISPGETATATMTGFNDSDVPVHELKLSDTGFFTEDLTLGKITDVSWPDGATSGKVVFHYSLNGSAPSGAVCTDKDEFSFTAAITDGSVSAPPQEHCYVTGFDVVFTSAGSTTETDGILGKTSGQTHGASSTVKFTISADKDAVNSGTARYTNKLTTYVTQLANGKSANDDDTADLAVVNPDVFTRITKSITKQTAVHFGEPVVTTLNGQFWVTSEQVVGDSITLTDQWDGTNTPTAQMNGNGSFWNAFDLHSVPVIQVGSNLQLEIQVTKTPAANSDSAWKTIYGPTSGDTTLITAADIATAVGFDADQVVGIRFIYTPEAGQLISAIQNVSGQFVSTARSKTRLAEPTDSDTHPATSPGGNSVDIRQYDNTATILGDGHPKDDPEEPLSDFESAYSFAKIIGYGDGKGTIYIGKSWNNQSLPTLSGSDASATLTWGVWGNYDSVAISDPNSSTPSSYANTAFDVFDLTGVEGIDASTPAGAFLKYDKISKVELFYDPTPSDTGNGDYGWHAIGPKNSGSSELPWQDSSRSFDKLTVADYITDETELGTVVGIRITVVPDSQARTDAIAAGDAETPLPTSGVSQGQRQFKLDWKLRDTLRSAPSTWIDADTVFQNGLDAGWVRNTAGIAGCTLQAPNDCDTSGDTGDIKISNPTLGVSVTKSSTGRTKSVTPSPGNEDPFFIPTDGTFVTAGQSTTYTVTAHNTSSVPATYLRITDPKPCDDLTAKNCASAGTSAGATDDPFEAAVFTAGTNPAQGLAHDWITGSPFDRFAITKISVVAPSYVDLADATVHLLTFNGTTYDVQSANIVAGEVDVPAEVLATVIGYSITFDGTDGTGPGKIKQDDTFTVTVSTSLRDKVLSNNANNTLQASAAPEARVNTAFAQTYELLFHNQETKNSCKNATEATQNSCIDGALASAPVYFSGGNLAATAEKTIETVDGAEAGIAQLYEPHWGTDVHVTLEGTSGGGTLAPTTVRLTDDTAGFWDEFELKSLGDVSADDFAADTLVSVGLKFDGAWTDGTANSDAVLPPLPPGKTLADASGIRFTFYKADGSYITTDVTDADWDVTADLTFVLRNTDADAIGEQPRSNTLGVTAWRCNVPAAGGAWSEPGDGCLKADDDDTQQIQLGSGSRELQISKVAQLGKDHYTLAGNQVRWDITLHNAGEGYLDVDKVTDTFDTSQFRYLVTDLDKYGPRFETDGTLGSGGGMTVDSSVPGQLTFAWTGSKRMQPGETATITVWLELQPILHGVEAENTASVTLAQGMEATCALYENHALTVGAGDDEVTIDTTGTESAGDCGAKDYVETLDQDYVFSRKGVVGALDGAINPVTDTQCDATIPDPSTASDDGVFYPVPCIANSEINGTDSWVLHTVNAGTKPIKDMVLVDQLPVEGDKMLYTGEPRDSDWRPVLLSAPEVHTDAAATWDIQVATTTNTGVSGVCANGGGLDAGPTVCQKNGENWQSIYNADHDVVFDNWAAVLGIRVVITFDGELGAGEGVDVTYSTQNVPQSDASGDDSLLDDSDSVLGKVAWNQFGSYYQFVNDPEWLLTIPNAVGVRLMNPTVTVEKNAINGNGSFDFTLNQVEDPEEPTNCDGLPCRGTESIEEPDDSTPISDTQTVTTATDEDGNNTGSYTWANLAPNAWYTLTEAPAARWNSEAPECTITGGDVSEWGYEALQLEVGAKFYLPAGATVTCSFTNTYVPPPPATPKTYAVGDYVWVDANSDGIQDAGETLLPGVRVTLYDADGAVVGTTTTNSQGLYLFDNLPAGDYRVRFTLTPEQAKIYGFTGRDQGSDNAVDSDADTETGYTVVFTLGDGNANLTKGYTLQAFAATEGIDPTWDAGVILLEVAGTSQTSTPPKSTDKTGNNKPEVSGQESTEVKDNIAYTGVDAFGMGLLALLLLAGGGLLIGFAGRRRQPRKH